jgi:hypothetical protein
MTVWDDILSNPANLRSIIKSHVSSDAAPLKKLVAARSLAELER